MLYFEYLFDRKVRQLPGEKMDSHAAWVIIDVILILLLFCAIGAARKISDVLLDLALIAGLLLMLIWQLKQAS